MTNNTRPQTVDVIQRNFGKAVVNLELSGNWTLTEFDHLVEDVTGSLYQLIKSEVIGEVLSMLAAEKPDDGIQGGEQAMYWKGRAEVLLEASSEQLVALNKVFRKDNHG